MIESNSQISLIVNWIADYWTQQPPLRQTSVQFVANHTVNHLRRIQAHISQYIFLIKNPVRDK